MNAPVSPHVLRKPLPAEFLDALQAIFGARLSTADAVREHHGRDESPYPPMPPDAVVFAKSTDEVASLVGLCVRYRVPLIPYGVGSSLEGHLLALQGGVCVDLSQMNQVLAVHSEDLTVTVQAGVTRKQLNQHLRDTGFFFPIDPGADATIGGMTATGASGTNAVRYGTMRENVLALTVVTGEGKVSSHRSPREKIERRVRPDAPLRRQRRHARRHHRDHAAHISTAGSGFGCVVFVPYRRRCGADDDRNDTDGNSDRALRVARRADGQGGQRARQARAARDAAAAVRVSRFGSERCRAGGSSRGNCTRARRRRIRLGDTPGRPDAPMGSAAQRVLRVSATEAGMSQLHDRRVRADLATRRVHRRARFATPSNRFCRRRSSATSATATFIARSWPTHRSPKNWPKPSG